MLEPNYYPKKPDLKNKIEKNNKKKTLISILIFALFLVVFGSKDFLFIFLLISVLLIHELGHLIFMKLFGYSNVKMLFLPLIGAFVEGKKDVYKQRQSIFVVIAGPLPGIIIGMLLLYFGVKWKVEWMNDFAFIFLFLNILNLLPLDPLDGGQLLKLLFNKNHEFFQLAFTFISSVIIIGVGWYFELWFIVIFGFLMGFKVRANQKKYMIHKELDKENVNYVTTYKVLSNKDFSIIKQNVINYTPTLQKYISQVDDSSAIDTIIADQVNSILVNPIEKNASILFKMLVILMWISAFLAPFFLLKFLDVIIF